jgi:hypothetical protein
MKMLLGLFNNYFNTVINCDSILNTKYTRNKEAIFTKNIQEWFIVEYEVQKFPLFHY